MEEENTINTEIRRKTTKKELKTPSTIGTVSKFTHIRTIMELDRGNFPSWFKEINIPDRITEQG